MSAWNFNVLPPLPFPESTAGKARGKRLQKKSREAGTHRAASRFHHCEGGDAPPT
jgi:hypothetical protein